MSGSKLVENLAESLVNELSESKTLDLMNDTKFKEFTDLLWEILDRVDKAEDREKAREENKGETESLESVKELTDKINAYFSGVGVGGDNGSKDLTAKTDRILKIVQDLQSGDNGESGGDEESGGDKDNESDDKKKKKKLGLSKKQQKDIEQANEKKESEKKEAEQFELDKQTVMMLKKLSKGFEESEKKRKKENSIIRKGLKRVERKIGSFIWKALNKFKGLLLIGALIFFRKPIMNLLSKLYEKYIEPYVAPIIEKIGKAIGEWFKDTFPALNEWIKKDFPKLVEWIKTEWASFKDWLVNTFPEIKKAIDAILESRLIRQLRRWGIKDDLSDLREQRKNAKTSAEKAEIDAKIAELDYERNKLDNAYAGDKFSYDYESVPITRNGITSNFSLPGYMPNLDDPNGAWQYIGSPQELEKYMSKRVEKAKSKSNDYTKRISKPYFDNSETTISNSVPNAVSTPEPNNYPEYDNPEGGLSGSSSLSDAASQQGTHLFDFGRQIVNYTPFNNVNISYTQVVDQKKSE